MPRRRAPPLTPRAHAPLHRGPASGTLLLVVVGLGACAPPEEPGPAGPFHDPWTVMPSAELPPVRGWRVVRGIVHSHSPYSHDACDGEPFAEGVRNEDCFEDCRGGPCRTRQDFVFLTDHDDLFAQHPYPDVLLHQEGDRLVERDGHPVANWIACGDDHEVLVAAGTETGMMPIGLEHHVGETVEERELAYNEVSPAAVLALRQAGALVLLQHTEGWELSQILELEVDGIELYNLHQNMMDNMGDVATMVLTYVVEPEEVPIPELGLIAVFQENQRDLEHLARASALRRLPVVIATDAHQNVFNDETYDGERMDSFRRMMHWFSNHLLVPSGQEIDDRLLKAAIAEGRLYGAFEYLGYPVGFDFHAEAGGQTYDMGQEISGAAEVRLRLVAPSLYRRDPEGAQPEVQTRILRAVEGEWQEVASGDGDLEIDVGAGAYRAEVRMVPHHLKPWLGRYPDDFMRSLPWVYSNPIYVRG